jgi:hypothetical protein
MTEYTIEYPVDDWEYRYGNHEITKRQARTAFLEQVAAQGLEPEGKLVISGLIENELVPGARIPRAHVKVFGHVKPKEA